MSEIYGTFSTAYVEAMRLRLSALEAESKQAREDEAWAHQMHVGCIAREEDGWVASAWNVKMQSIDQANAATIHEAIRALREKVEGGAR